jgi:DNA-binding NarL/FixJ family response regulator
MRGDGFPHRDRRIRILIADDSPAILDAVEKRLSSQYDVVARVSDGTHLVDSVTQLKPDILITDISMPQLSGIEALRRLRALGIGVPTIILTVHEDEEFLRAALQLNALGFVLKPQLDAELLEAIQHALENKLFISEKLRNKFSIPE